MTPTFTVTKVVLSVSIDGTHSWDMLGVGSFQWFPVGKPSDAGVP